MSKDGINAKIKSVDFEGGIIAVSFDNGTPHQTVTYSTTPEIDEVIEEVKETKSGKWINDENDQPKWEVTTHEETIQVPTGKKIPNPNYRNPQSIEDLESICLENGFTK